TSHPPARPGHPSKPAAPTGPTPNPPPPRIQSPPPQPTKRAQEREEPAVPATPARRLTRRSARSSSPSRSFFGGAKSRNSRNVSCNALMHMLLLVAELPDESSSRAIAFAPSAKAEPAKSAGNRSKSRSTADKTDTTHHQLARSSGGRRERTTRFPRRELQP